VVSWCTGNFGVAVVHPFTISGKVRPLLLVLRIYKMLHRVTQFERGGKLKFLNYRIHVQFGLRSEWDSWALFTTFPNFSGHVFIICNMEL
jgi:hypothetical protein